MKAQISISLTAVLLAGTTLAMKCHDDPKHPMFPENLANI